MSTSAKFSKTQKQVSETKAKNVVIEQPQVQAVFLEIEGTAELIQNNFSQKAIEEMLRKHMGISVQREKKNPRQCIEDATIKNTEGQVCIPPTAIKKAILSAASQIKSMKKTQIRSGLFLPAKSIPITYKSMEPRMDMVRTSGISRTPDVRFRPSFVAWKARVEIVYNHEFQVQSVVDLLSRAGNVGIGEWRPEKDGTFGTFKISRNITGPKEIAEVRDICSVPLVPLRIPEWALDVEISPEILRRIAGGDQEED